MKFWIFIYQRTGYVSRMLIQSELDYIYDKLDFVGKCDVGTWQCDVGLTIWSAHVIWPDDKLHTRIYKRLRRLVNV